MEDNAKCFIKIKKGCYEEITYKELERRRNEDNTYRNKKFIYIHKMLMEVSKEEYVSYYREIERNRYAKRILRRFSEISLEHQQNGDEDIRDKDVVIDPNCNVESEVIKKDEIRRLKNALLELTEDEFLIIKTLYYEEKTLRDYAGKIEKHHTTVQYYRDKIIERLRIILKK